MIAPGNESTGTRPRVPRCPTPGFLRKTFRFGPDCSTLESCSPGTEGAHTGEGWEDMEKHVRDTGAGSRNRAAPASKRPAADAPITILVLDDEESIRWVIDKTLRGPAYRLRFAVTA